METDKMSGAMAKMIMEIVRGGIAFTEKQKGGAFSGKEYYVNFGEMIGFILAWVAFLGQKVKDDPSTAMMIMLHTIEAGIKDGSISSIKEGK